MIDDDDRAADDAMDSDAMQSDAADSDAVVRGSTTERSKRSAIEAGIGLALAALALWAITAAGGDVTFVYQGL